jgi:hypothetical protein
MRALSGVVLDAAGALDAAATERRRSGLRRDPNGRRSPIGSVVDGA